VQQEILGRYTLPRIVHTEPGGGTANPKSVLVTENGRFLLRRRRLEFSAPEIVEYDHSLLSHLHDSGLPVPEVLRAVDGQTWVEQEGAVYEIHSWIDCEPFRQENREQVRNAGRTLGRLHRATERFTPRGQKAWPREDHPDRLLGELEPLRTRARSEERRVAELLREELEAIAAALPDDGYRQLPQVIVHADYHAGNVEFAGDEVAGIFDWDWADRQSRLLDVRDGLHFLAFRRPADMDSDDIWSLTQPATPSVTFSRAFLDGYSEQVGLTAEERGALPVLLRSRLCQMRIRGARKVPNEEKLRFLTWGIEKQLRWVREEWDGFAEAVFGVDAQ
jgi:Ser/Thr protein kinase RdoA (MazF antagonist)